MWDSLPKNVEIYKLKVKSQNATSLLRGWQLRFKAADRENKLFAKWVCKGFSKKWKMFLETYGKRAVEVWDEWLAFAEFRNFKEKI